MSLTRIWVVRCDAPGCLALIVHDPIPGGEKWDYGEATNDLGWEAAPGRTDTFCPKHFRKHSVESDTRDGDDDGHTVRP